MVETMQVITQKFDLIFRVSNHAFTVSFALGKMFPVLRMCGLDVKCLIAPTWGLKFSFSVVAWYPFIELDANGTQDTLNRKRSRVHLSRMMFYT